MTPLSTLEVDLSAVRHNVQQLLRVCREHRAPAAPAFVGACAALKADAYGMCAVPVARVLNDWLIATNYHGRGVDEVRGAFAPVGNLDGLLAITRNLNGHRLDRAPFKVFAPDRAHRVVTGPRIGITKAMEVHWRIGLEGSPFLSRRFA